MPSKLLESCLTLADTVEHQAGVLGLVRNGDAELVRLCHEFRRSCREIAGNRGIERITLAFTGPKNSGKTCLLSQFVRAEGVRKRLRVGYARAEATEKTTWVGPEPPADLRPEYEAHIHCSENEMEAIGFPYTLVDVPGLNEADEGRAKAARRALDNALIKVFVVAQREMEDKAVFQYLSRADGSLILPVINFVREEPSSGDVEGFRERLRTFVPHAEVMSPVLIPDLGLSGDGDDSRAVSSSPEMAVSLRKAIGEAAGFSRMGDVPRSQLLQTLRRFQEEVSALVTAQLPASRRALDALREFERSLPRETLGHLLEPESVFRAGVRQRLRTVFLQRTPYAFFPWRLVLVLANLLHGALERVPLALMGSVPSFVSSAFAAARNLRDARRFSQGVQGGIRDYVESAVKEKITPGMRDLEFALNRELGTEAESSAGRSEELEVTVTGLENLQARSSGIFQRAVETWAPSRPAAILYGLCGFLIFWGFFAWPVYGLYLDFFQAVRDTIAGGEGVSGNFPAAPFGMLGTSLLLALLPMGFFMLVTLSVLVRPGRVTECVDEIRREHDEAVAELVQSGLLTVKVEQPRLDACMYLINLPSERIDG